MNNMKCKDCNYYKVNNFDFNGKSYTESTCKITNRVDPKGCSINHIEDLDICYNCKHWIGGGDWGLSCRKDYYIASTNGFEKACEQFERR